MNRRKAKKAFKKKFGVNPQEAAKIIIKVIKVIKERIDMIENMAKTLFDYAEKKAEELEK